MTRYNYDDQPEDREIDDAALDAHIATTEAAASYRTLILSIADERLRDRIDDSAQANASDTAVEQGFDPQKDARFWLVAIATAEMILDCPADHYPELRSSERRS